MDRDEVLRRVEDHVSYLHGDVAIAVSADWIACAVIISDPVTLAAVVRATMAGFGTDDESVAASLFAEAYAFRVAGVALVAFALDLPVPNVAPERVAVRVDQPRPAAVAYLDPEVRAVDAVQLVDALIGGHLQPFVAAVHAEFAVGERLLWGNVAAACAVAFRAVEANVDDAAAVRERAEAFFAAGQRWFAGLGAFSTVEHDGREGWYWDRTSCCLWFKTPSSRLCDNCSLIDPAELRAHRIRELAGEV